VGFDGNQERTRMYARPWESEIFLVNGVIIIVRVFAYHIPCVCQLTSIGKHEKSGNIPSSVADEILLCPLDTTLQAHLAARQNWGPAFES